MWRWLRHFSLTCTWTKRYHRTPSSKRKRKEQGYPYLASGDVTTRSQSQIASLIAFHAFTEKYGNMRLSGSPWVIKVMFGNLGGTLQNFFHVLTLKSHASDRSRFCPKTFRRRVSADQKYRRAHRKPLIAVLSCRLKMTRSALYLVLIYTLLNWKHCDSKTISYNADFHSNVTVSKIAFGSCR